MPNAIYTLLDSITKRSLAMFGLEIRRLQPVIQNDELIATTEEVSRIYSNYKNFYDLNPTYSHWPNTIKDAREYMSPGRIDSYYRFLRLCEEEISLDGKTIIDVGCCLGGLLDILSTRHTNTKLFGIDANPGFVEFTKFMCPVATVKLHNISEGSFDNFDIIFCNQVLEHMARPECAIDNMLSMLNPNGLLLITVPDGRIDTQPAKSFDPNSNSYAGHINFWSSESWSFLIDKHAGRREWKTEKFKNEGLYAIIRAE